MVKVIIFSWAVSLDEATAVDAIENVRCCHWNSRSAKKLKDIVMCILEGNQDSAPGLHYCFLTVPPLVSVSLPFLTSCISALLCWNSGNVLGAEWSLYPSNKKWGHRKAFVPKESHKILLYFSMRRYRAHRQSVGREHQGCYCWLLLSWAQGVKETPSLLPYLPLTLKWPHFCPPGPHMELCPWETCWDLLRDHLAECMTEPS